MCCGPVRYRLIYHYEFANLEENRHRRCARSLGLKYDKLPTTPAHLRIQNPEKRLKVCIVGSQSLTATGRHLPYGITQCYLPPDTSERARLFTYPGWMEGCVDLDNATAGVELAISRSQVRRPNHYITQPPRTRPKCSRLFAAVINRCAFYLSTIRLPTVSDLNRYVWKQT